MRLLDVRMARPVLRRALADEAGVTLVETLIAVLILATAVLALVATAATSTVSLRLSRDRQQATQAASAAIEDVRALTYADVQLLDDGTIPATHDPDGAGGQSAEDVVMSTSGALPHTTVDGRFTTTVWVTRANGAANTLKRIIATTTWEDRGQERSVTETTLVAAAQRGVPAPDFMVTPSDSTVTGVAGDPACFTHFLQNLGETDRYSFMAGLDDGAGGFASGSFFQITTDGHGFTIPDPGSGGSWFAVGELADQDGNLLAMTDSQPVDSRPDSVEPVPRRKTAELRFCFIPSDGSVDPTPNFRVRLFSVFDDSVNKDIVERVTDVEVERTLFLAKGSGNNRTKFEMTEQSPVRTTSIDYDSPSDGVSGLRLRAGQASDRVNWDYQPGAGTRVEGPATLNVWIATPRTLSGTPDPGPLSLEVTLSKVQANNGSLVANLYNATVLISHLPAEWNLVSVPLDGLSGAAFTANEVLRLSIVNSSASSETAHLHFDADLDAASSGATDQFLSNLTASVFAS